MGTSLGVIDRYLLREALLTFAAVTLVVIVVLATNSLAYMLGKVVEGELAAEALMPLFGISLAESLATMIPLGLYLGLLLMLGRLHAEGEMAALGACGVGYARLYRPLLIAALIAALLSFAMGGWVSPWAKREQARIEAEMAARSELAGIVPGRFNRSADGDVILFVESIGTDGALEEVFVEATDEAGVPHLVRAERAVERRDPDTGARFLVFERGNRYSGTPGGGDFRAIEFDTHGIRLSAPQPASASAGRKGRPIGELWSSDAHEDRAELQWRFGMPIACLLLALASVPLSHTTPRQGRYAKLAPALVLYLVYANFMVYARELVVDGHVPPWIGMWWAHALVLALIGLGLAWRVGWRWTRMLVLRRTPELPR